MENSMKHSNRPFRGVLFLSWMTTLCIAVLLFFIQPTATENDVCRSQVAPYYYGKKILANRFVERIAEGFARTPQKVLAGSLCEGMAGTCCSLKMEREVLLKNLEKESHKKYVDVIAERLKPLDKAGRRLNIVVFNIFSASKDLLTAEVARIMNTTLENAHEFFDDFFNHIYKLVYTRNLCYPLLNVNTTIRNIVQHVADREWRFNLTDLPLNSTNISKCSSDLENALVDMWYQPIINQLAPVLDNIKQLADAINVISEISLELQRYKVSDQCLKELFTLDYCAACGGHPKARLCGGHCLNVYRGCFYELAELKPAITMLSSRIRILASIVSNNIEPLKLTKEILSVFVHLANSTVNSIKYTVESGNCSIHAPRTPVATDYYTSLSPIPPTSSARLETIFEVTKKELQYFTQLESVLLEIPEDMCSINPKHLKYILKLNCWNGKALGSYTEVLAGRFEGDQINNPAFKKYKKMEVTRTYRKLRSIIRKQTSKVDFVISRYECSRDDADCNYEMNITCFKHRHTSPDGVDGSGDGSGMSDSSGDGYNVANKAPVNRVQIVIVSDLPQSSETIEEEVTTSPSNNGTQEPVIVEEPDGDDDVTDIYDLEEVTENPSYETELDDEDATTIAPSQSISTTSQPLIVPGSSAASSLFIATNILLVFSVIFITHLAL